jgi:hypothetical protein
MTFKEWMGANDFGDSLANDTPLAQVMRDAWNAAIEECARIIEAQDVDPALKHRMASAIRSRSSK